jgi:hypothetical protein
VAGWKALNLTVTTASRWIVPATRPSSYSSHVANTAFSAGTIIKNTTTGNYYWAAVGGTTAAGSVAPTHTDGDATDGSVTWRYLRRMRQQLTVQAASGNSASVFLGYGVAAENAKGVELGAGDAVELKERECPQGPLYAIAASGTQTLTIQEA